MISPVVSGDVDAAGWVVDVAPGWVVVVAPTEVVVVVAVGAVVSVAVGTVDVVVVDVTPPAESSLRRDTNTAMTATNPRTTSVANTLRTTDRRSAMAPFFEDLRYLRSIPHNRPSDQSRRSLPHGKWTGRV